MWHLPVLAHLRSDVLALQANVERAGSALACPFSCSEEFEAAVIRAHRQAGDYGPKRNRRYVMYASVVAGVLALLAWIF